MVAHPHIDTSTLDTLKSLGAQQDELSRAVSRGQPAIRAGENILALDAGSATPLLAAQGHDVAINMQGGVMRVVDETGSQARPIHVSSIQSPTWADQPLRVYGEIGDPGQAWNAYATLHGDSNGRHYGEVGASGGPLFNHYGDTYGVQNGRVFGEIGVPGQGWHAYITSHGWHDGDSGGVHFGDNHGRNYGETGAAGGPYFNHYGDCYGNVFPPSARAVKRDIKDIADDIADILEATPSFRWRYEEGIYDDGQEHAGPMVEDLLRHVPWLVRETNPTGTPVVSDRDLIGVLWATLRVMVRRARNLIDRADNLAQKGADLAARVDQLTQAGQTLAARVAALERKVG